MNDGAPPPPKYDAPPIAKNPSKYNPPSKRDQHNSPTKSFDSLEPTARSNGTVSASQVVPDNQFMVKAENGDSEW